MMEKMKMASRKPGTSKASRQLQGAGEFAGPDAEKEAIEKIAQAKVAAETEAEQDKKKGDNGGPILDKDAWRRAANESIAEDLEIERLQEQIAECRGRLSSIRKVAKSCGVDWDVVKDYRKLQRRIRNGEMGAIVTEHRRLGELMQILDCPLYTQFDLFKLPVEAAPRSGEKPGMDAELQGQAAWRNSEPRSNNPFQQGTEEFVAWDTGYGNAQAAAVKGMGPTNGVETSAQ
jgi:hypothetical protein